MEGKPASADSGSGRGDEQGIRMPLFSPAVAPRITSTSHSSLVKWKRERRQYEEQVKARANAAHEDLASLIVSVKDSFDSRLLSLWCKLRWKIDEEDATDDMLITEIDRIISTVKNDTLPDIVKLFKDRLHMDLKESDVHERVLQYFKHCYDIIEENGLSKCFEGSNGAREKCKLLRSSLEPAELRDAVDRAIRYLNPKADEDETALHDLILEKALEQERTFQLRSTMNKSERGHTRTNQGDSKNPNKKQRSEQPSSTSNERSPKTKPSQEKTPRPPPSPCPKCSKMHWLSDCSEATEQEKIDLRKQLSQKRSQKERRSTTRISRLREYIPTDDRLITLNGVLTMVYCPDSGADRTVISRAHWQKLCDLDPSATAVQLSQPIDGLTFGENSVTARESTMIRIQIHTAAGPVAPVDSFECLIVEEDDAEFILGNDILKAIGIDVDRQIEQLAQRQCDDDDRDSEPPSRMDKYDDDEGGDIDIRTAVQDLVNRAVANGFPIEKKDELRRIVHKFDVWRLELTNDPPARVPPLEIRLKDGSRPFKCKPRKYPPQFRKFLVDFNRKLEDLGWIYENANSRWACPALPVKKPGAVDGMRQTVDYRPVNGLTEVMAAVMPILSVVLENVRGKKHFGLFDFLKGFWQLPLATHCQEWMSYMTDSKVYTPRRVPQGCSDAPIFFQQTMENCFKPLLYEFLLIWIDDLLLYAEDIDTYLKKLEELFDLLDSFGLKLSVKKSSLYQTTVKWCGKIISHDGVSHDPDRINCLKSIPYPTTAGQLQQFLCASNWMRDSLIDYARVASPLQTKLDSALAQSKRTKRVAAGIFIDLDDTERNAFDSVKALLANAATLAFPDDEATTCLFTDASDSGWAVIVTQVATFNQSTPIVEQQHKLLTCMGGSFTGAQVNWSVIEKEAFPIITACDKLDYLLLMPRGFHVFCDHRNLIHVFAPGVEVKKHVRGKLLRWALKLSGYRYVIDHIDGPKNVWADMISRWAGPAAAAPFIVRVIRSGPKRKSQRKPPPVISTTPVLRPLDDEGFIWPSLVEIISIQSQEDRPASGKLETNGVVRINDRIWIPATASELITRLCIIAHCGSQGHRGQRTMFIHLSALFDISNLSAIIADFVGRCLLCHHVKGGKMIRRPWGETIKCSKRNALLHFDFLHLGESFGKSKYLLVLKDHATHFTELVVCDSADSTVTTEALLEWHSRFGIPSLWVSDQGTHFKNEVIHELSRRLKTQHQFTPAYCPWINGSVERINRDILQVLRAMILEYKISHKDWVYLVPMIQSNINHTPVPSLGSKAPIELFTGLERPSPLKEFYLPNDHKLQHVPEDSTKINKFLEELRESIHVMHGPVKDSKLKQELLNRRRQRGQQEVNFDVGDFVLRSRVDEKHANKLQVMWIGPYMIVRADSHSFRIKHLVSGEEMDVHASRLKFYADSSLNVTTEILEHISAQGTVLAVERLKQHRWNDSIRDFELLVGWRGLQEIEDSWESLDALSTQIRVMVDAYVKAQDDSKLRDRWNQLLDPLHPLVEPPNASTRSKSSKRKKSPKADRRSKRPRQS